MSFERRFDGFAGQNVVREPVSQKPSFLRGTWNACSGRRADIARSKQALKTRHIVRARR